MRSSGRRINIHGNAVCGRIERSFRPSRGILLAACLYMTFAISGVCGQIPFENRHVNSVEMTIDGAAPASSETEQFRAIAADTIGSDYSAVRIRESIEALHRTGRIVSVVVKAKEDGPQGVIVHYLVKLQTQADKVNIQIGNMVGTAVKEQDLLFKLSLLNPGASINDQALKDNANLILEYLRDLGYFNAEVSFKTHPIPGQNRVGVTFIVNPNLQVKVQEFKINIEGYDTSKLLSQLKLKPGEPYTRDLLTKDVEKIKDVLRKDDFLAPELEEARRVFDSEKNTISIGLTGKAGPKVNITLDTKKEKIGSSTLTKLLPVKRDGTLDYSAIVEGERRLENYYQEQGYFFADVTPVCSVTPPLTEAEGGGANNTEFLCSTLSNTELMGKTVDLKYRVDLNRRLKLVDIRLKGTSELTIDDVRTVLESQTANILGVIPLFGYGRGYTSERILEEDTSTIQSLMRELGYSDAKVRVNQGVSPAGDNLIITFIVDEGPPTIVNDIEIAGNVEIAKDKLLAQLPPIAGQNYSRAKIRNAERKLAEYYSAEGYFDAHITSSLIEQPADTANGQKMVRVVLNVENEGKRVYVGRVLVTGNENTKEEAILRAVTLHPNQPLRASDIYTSEQNLYASDVFSNVDIKPQPAGDRPDGARIRDVIISVTEQAPRLAQYGGGYSTDVGLNGFFDIRHFNLMGRLWQGGARVRWSQRQQLVQFDFINPRFLRDGKNRFAPLTLSAQYQRDSTVTRFFRSAFDTGTFGIVQRIDENGKPIDEFGNDAGSPTINRLSFTAETNRTIDRKHRSVLYVRYRLEDVRLFNIESLLIKDLLLPDSRIRISGFGANLVRDTRENCSIKYSLLQMIAKGEPSSPCRYDAGDPTRGDFLTAEYNVSLPALGANIGFNKFQASYNAFYTFPQFSKITFAGRAILGMANVFAKGNRFSNVQFPDLDGILPISERFFAGGAFTLRGFDFETAGPRVVIVPQGTFRNSKGDPVFLDPFTVPFGGNALAVLNLEARIKLSKSLRAVPFYDGGNVFRKAGDIFNPPDVPPNDVFRENLRSLWSHTVGLGLRLKTPVGGEFGVDFGYLLNPPSFQIPQPVGPNAIYRLRQEQIHFRFSQAF
jgi:outer membrane protein insertion porin family